MWSDFCHVWLSLDAAGGQTCHQMLFDAQEQDDDRDGGINRGGEQILPLNHVESIENIDTNGDRLQDIRGDQRQCDGIFVPGVDEHENQRGDAYSWWSDARGEVYSNWSDTRGDLYSFYSDMRSELYSGDIDGASDELQDFKDKISKMK